MSKVLETSAGVIWAGIAALVAGVILVLLTVKAIDVVTDVSVPEENSMNNEVDQIEGTPLTQPEMVGTITAKDDQTSIYTNDLLGLAFEYPSTYSINEVVALDGDFSEGKFFQGDHVGVHILNEQKDTVFEAEAVSQDFALEAMEGCCYFFKGTLDLSKSTPELEQDLAAQLDQVFGVEKELLGGKQSVSFSYTTQYVSIVKYHGAVTPNPGTVYPNVFFSSGVLGAEPVGTEITYPFSDIDTAIEADFMQILESVTWLNE